jgi:guanylate kinase
LPANPLTFVLIGPGGVGKGTVARALIARDPQLWLSRSWTTRQPRPIETGKDYHFVSRAEFEAAIDQGVFLEWAEFHGNLYGTPKPVAPEGCDVLLEIEVQGAQQVRANDAAAVIFLLSPPSQEELERRLRGRGDDDEHVYRRLTSSNLELEIGRSIATVEIINDNVDEVLDRIAAIMEERRLERSPREH